ncbi:MULTISPECIES: DUF6233 domain-containing protein [unclassified Streptomyces]|uniref:DUF6233 domain-containing protein n=1 Tax=unclassified Streptomyces TaxID=2593676 RepID=UPI00225A40EC|nr:MULTISPECIES: DUF6233 domain-containing protein [unclassified Streptomyces]WSP58616.1 DUF6233 domain-containing protein [Streptomyces sp. NBC_01241]WSU20806.1 DUF6233 domain-containing protein [Streptomyces sp. NBC_01108]MCX4790391.1 DUF6233 domain-containing protein [Streptomyces sp. NBC_01221]MCX4793880.1 DUF6233 domain-containing protein [Streptomyces sp. NBC_01242]WSJ35296.1 DUF6233 domain-containing protein [Streptomyces sp. NBC_01321]
MYDLPPDLPRLRTLETYLGMLLAEVQQQIATVEQRGEQQSKEPRDREQPSKAPRRPPTPDWGIVDAGAGSPTTEVHRGDCWAAGKKLRPISRERAVAELADGATACEVCRPDTVLDAP